MKVEKRKEYNLKQLNIEIPKELLTRIKFNAVKRNIPLRTWILRVLINSLSVENKD